MPANEGPDDPIDVELVRRLADLLTESGLSEIEVERDGLRIRVARGLAAAEIQAVTALPAQAPQALIEGPAAPASLKGEPVKSPMVGTVYLQANPGAPPFVRPGDRVEAGQTLMIIEAMKTMNPVPAPRAGVVLEILVDDAQPVEFGEPLLVLE